MTSATATAPAKTTVQLATGPIDVSIAGEGEAIVLIHHDNAAPGWSALFEELSRDFKVIVPDLPGFGGSQRLEWARHPRDFGAVLQILLDRLAVSSATVVGLGFGGWVAAEMAPSNQARFRRLVLVGAMGVKPPEGDIADQMLMDFPAYTKAGFANPETFNALYGEQPIKEQVMVWDYAREVIARIAWKPYMFSHQLPHILTNLDIPTLVVWGDSDAIVPRSAGQRIAALIPGAKLEIVKDAGHFVDVEQPAALAALIRAHARS